MVPRKHSALPVGTHEVIGGYLGRFGDGCNIAFHHGMGLLTWFVLLLILGEINLLSREI